MHLRNMLVALLALQALSAHAQSWDSIVGSVASVGEPTPHWFTVRGGHTGYVVDGDSGEVKGTMTLSLFSPALRPHLEKGRIYSYGSYYTRTYYGDRTDVVLVFDANSMLPIKEIEIPPKSAGIGHSGMIGLVDGRFLGIWNITPAMSVSLVDVEKDEFLSEISTPGCAGVYPLGKGFLMACGSGTLQYITLDDSGKETDRVVSETFFDVAKDPVFDYAVPTANGWLFVSFDGLVFEATVDRGKVRISEPWAIVDPEDEKDGKWRIGGRQPFAYNATTGVLVTLMHEGGGQETFEDAGTEVWAFDVGQQRRGYRLKLEEPAMGVQLTTDAEPLLVISPDKARTVSIHDARTGRKLRDIEDFGGGLIQPMLGQTP
jgi:methylamine dehydrogenase heavy chain